LITAFVFSFFHLIIFVRNDELALLFDNPIAFSAVPFLLYLVHTILSSFLEKALYIIELPNNAVHFLYWYISSVLFAGTV